MKSYIKTTAIFIGMAVLTTAAVSCRNNTIPETIEGIALGTLYKVTVTSNAPANMRSKVEHVCAEADSMMSVFNPHSLLSRLNRNETDSLTEDIVSNIELARKVSEMSNGKYDITVHPIVEAYGFVDGTPQTDADIDSLLKLVGYDKIEIRDGRLVKQNPGTQITLNSIAKGYTVDKVASMLETEGVRNYLVNIGGEIFCRGVNPNGENWHIAIDTPYEGNYAPGASTSKIINVSGMGVATSGNYRNFLTASDGRKFTHIIDPTTGGTTESDLLSATVVAESCALADAMGTMFMALGYDASLRLLEAHPEIAALLIYSDASGNMKIHASTAMEQYL